MAPWIKAQNGNVFEVVDPDLVPRYANRPGFSRHETDPREDGTGGGEADAQDGVAARTGVAPGEKVGNQPAPPTARSSKAELTAWAEHLGIEVPDGADKAAVKKLIAEHAEAKGDAGQQPPINPVGPETAPGPDPDKSEAGTGDNGQPAGSTNW